jgi:putative membrane protein
MALLTQAEQQLIAATISAVERETDAELVTVLAERADHYAYIPTLWAAAIALLTPGVLALTPLWLGLWDLLIAQWSVFIVLALVLRWQPLLVRLIPQRLKRWRAAYLARHQFLEHNLHHTKNATGVLIFVSEAEHYVEIIADSGINQHVHKDEWQSIIDTFVTRIRNDEVAAGFVECVKACGELLKTHVPATSQKNELPNRMIILK